MGPTIIPIFSYVRRNLRETVHFFQLSIFAPIFSLFVHSNEDHLFDIISHFYKLTTNYKTP
jgi:hypothetical protein